MITLSVGVIFSFMMAWFLEACMPKTPFYISYIIGALSLGIYNLLMYFYLDPVKLGFRNMFIISWIQTMVLYVGQNFPPIAIIGRFTAYLPEGFESTGVTVLISIMNIGTLGGGLLTAAELQAYNVVDGYYERTKTVMDINCLISLGVSVVCPLFIIWKVKGLKKTQTKIENIEDQEEKEQLKKVSDYKSMKTNAADTNFEVLEDD